MAGKTALITGGSGLLGREVVKAFDLASWKVVGTALTRTSPPNIVKLDLLDENEIAKILDEVKPDVVVHCAADRFPDSCDKNPDRANALNAGSSKTLASLTSSRKIFLVYISTDYVFSGARGEAPYTTTATPSPPNIYGQTKLDGEKGVLEVTQQANSQDTSEYSAPKIPLGVVLRVPVLYGAASEPAESAINTLVTSVWKAQEVSTDARIKMDDWAQRYPTCTEDVGRVCVDISTLYTSDLKPSSPTARPLPRILHFSAEDRMTKYQICEIFAEILGLTLDGMEKWAPSEEKEQGGAKRPYDCHLDTSELRKLGVDVRTVDFKAWWRREFKAFRK
ncbi:RmlD substrate binding domain-containing protein [Patellaria atrata CBS 101060]|uniref:RmlD substrate binding domain-containing protein n=1 Tax=Patellaria atrata CBS 101060 TaxID=1346257 RepID=A0A9P4VPZ4_9PEZI|nr:RmlD substrate binding domain-containing protein [Patellaria atrata CBS 101060]